MIAAVTLISLFGIFYAYAGYPLLLSVLLKCRAGIVSSPLSSTTVPKLTVIITVRNESQVIKKKLEDTLALTYFGNAPHQLQILVASDASEDATDDIVRTFSSRGVQLVRLAERGGKESAQQAAIQKAEGEILFFTDAKIELNQEALEHVVRYFSDPNVGIVSSIDRVLHDDTEGSGEGFYIRYEMWLRRLESRFGTLVGVSGSAFAIRRSLCEPWRADIPSDFALLLNTKKAGFRGTLAEDVIGAYRAVKTEEEEFQRKVRTVLRGITTFFKCTDALNISEQPAFTWQLLSHKLCRWLVPWFVLIATLGLSILSFEHWIYFVLWIGIIVCYGFALVAFFVPAYRDKKLFKIPLFFTIANAAIFVAWMRFLSGKRTVTWSPSAKL